jgi:hypothetical protein
VRRELRHGFIDVRLHTIEDLPQFVVAHQIRARMALPRLDPLAEHNLNPRIFGE